MKNQIIFGLSGIIIVALGIFLFTYEGKAKTPITGENGKISGSYSIEGILSLQKPYICTFEKADQVSKVDGKVYTDGYSIYGTFDIQTKAFDNQRLTSFLLVKDNQTYTWTSLFPQGYKAPVTKSATKNARPEEQAQIVGTKDEMQYECEVWSEVDKTLFEIPTSVTFTDIKA